MQTETVQWSAAPCAAYSIDYEGQRYGIGLNPVFQVVPGAWNILVLSYATIEDLIPWTKPPGDFPVSVASLPAAVASALQIYPNTGQTIGELAATMQPKQFLKAVKGWNKLIMVQLYGPIWWDMAKDRAESLERINRNVVRVDFHNRQVLA